VLAIGFLPPPFLIPTLKQTCRRLPFGSRSICMMQGTASCRRLTLRSHLAVGLPFRGYWFALIIANFAHKIKRFGGYLGTDGDIFRPSSVLRSHSARCSARDEDPLIQRRRSSVIQVMAAPQTGSGTHAPKGCRYDNNWSLPGSFYPAANWSPRQELLPHSLAERRGHLNLHNMHHHPR